MKVLILSCNTGAGHNVCAQAIREQALALGAQCEIYDALQFVSPFASRFISGWHVRLYRHFPKIYAKSYSRTEADPDAFSDDSSAYRMLLRGCGPMREYLLAGGYDAAICTHLFPAMMLSALERQAPLPLRTCFVATDYTASPGCRQAQLSVCAIPSAALCDEFVRAGLSRESLLPCGMPVRRAFFEAPEKAEAKRRQGLEPAQTHLLVMGGSMGCGPMEKILLRLLRRLSEGCAVTVVCAGNEELKARLSFLCARRPEIRILGYCKDMAGLLASADVYLTKPGGLSTSEAAALRVPMVLVNAVGGCEAHNLDFFVSMGCAVSAPTPKKIAGQCLTLLTDDRKRARMARCCAELELESAARAICAAVGVQG